MAAPLDLRLLEGDLGCVPRIANVVARLPRSGPAPSVDAVLAGLTITDVLAAGRVVFKDGILTAESIRCGASSVAGLADTDGHAASATTARLAWTPSLLKVFSLLPAGSSTATDEWSISVDDAAVAWPIPGGAAEINVKGATANGSSTVCALGCQSAAFSVNNDAPVRLTEPTTCSQPWRTRFNLTSTCAIQARPAETAALLRCVCGIDALTAPARADIMLRATSPKVTVATAHDRSSGAASRTCASTTRRWQPPNRWSWSWRPSKRDELDGHAAVSAKAATLSSSGAVVSDLSLQATDDNVVVRAARADMDVDGRGLTSIIEVTSAIQNGFACRAWDYLGVSCADVEGEAVDFFAVEAERTTSICVDAVDASWNGLRLRGHVSSDGVSCTAVLEAARNGSQLLEPTLVHITADGVTLTNATALTRRSTSTRRRPTSALSSTQRTSSRWTAAGPSLARAAAIRFYATGTRLPAFLAAASDVCVSTGARGRPLSPAR